ncbi:MAG: response regulator [Anaerolineales bacterium]
MKDKLKILLVEDNESNQILMLRILERLGFSAVLAKNGREAVEKLAREAFDVILMDIHMPELDGVTAVKLIRQQTQNSRPPYIIAITAETSFVESEKYLRAGMDEVFTKPLAVEKLIASLRKVQEAIETGKMLAPKGTREPLPAAERQVSEVNRNTDHTKPPAIDSQILEDFRAMMGEEGDQAVKTLVTLFLRDTPKLWKEMVESTQQKAFEDLHRAAHTLKGNANQVGATRLAQYCKQLQEAAQKQDQAEAVNLLKIIREELAAVKNFLDNYL